MQTAPGLSHTGLYVSSVFITISGESREKEEGSTLLSAESLPHPLPAQGLCLDHAYIRTKRCRCGV